MPVRQLMQSVFTTANPFLARAFDFWQQGLLRIKSFSLTAEWNTLAASAVAAPPTAGLVTIDQGIVFILETLNFVAYPKPASVEQLALVTPNMNLRITEKSGASIYSDTDHPVSLWTGNALQAGGAYSFPFPRLIMGNNTLLPVLTDNGGTATHCYLGFEGTRIEFTGVSIGEVFPGIG